MPVLTLIEKALYLACLILESVPVELRRAQFLIWFAMTWPILKFFLQLAKVPDSFIVLIEDELKTAPVEKAKAKIARAQAKASAEPRMRTMTFDEYEEAA